MADAPTVVPGQWPPIGATKSMVSKYEPPAKGTPVKEQDTVMTEPHFYATIGERPLQQLSVSQLRTEISRLERHILELPQGGYAPLRDALETSLAEFLARKPEGQALDQAVARHKQAIKTRQLAQANLDQAQGSVRLATSALEQTKIAENLAAQEVQKQSAAISDFEYLRSGPAIPTNTVLGQAQLAEVHLQAVAGLLGTRLPPPPPPQASTPFAGQQPNTNTNAPAPPASPALPPAPYSLQDVAPGM